MDCLVKQSRFNVMFMLKKYNQILTVVGKQRNIENENASERYSKQKRYST